MMNHRGVTARLALVGTVTLRSMALADQHPPVRPLGSWVSSLHAICVDPACLEVAFTLDLNGFQQMGDPGDAVPRSYLGHLFNLSSPGGGLGYTIVIVTFASNRFRGNLADSGYVDPKAKGTTVTPEPLSMTLLSAGLVGLSLVARRRKKRQSV